MKSRYFFILFFYSFLIFAQQNNSVGKIEYGMTFLADSYTAELLYNSDKAIFTYSKIEESSEKADDEGNINIIVADTVPHKVYNDLKEKKLYEYLCIFALKKHDWVEENTPDFKWVLIDETKKIGSIECAKATCYFRGRNYIAWYSTEIKSYFGPWKFSGLPGLILELYDSENKVSFYAKKVSIPFVATMNIKPENTIPYDKVKLIQKEKSDEFIKSIESKQERGISIKVKVNSREEIEKE